jgi:MinD superfamily P-loop ATPase
VTSRVVSIAGAKGSPGCSFLALTLARCLAASNLSTLLLDGDAEGGGIAILLESLSPRQPRALDAPAIQIEARLWFAELGPSANGLDLVGAARAKHQAVVVDLGHSAGTTQKQISAASDWLLWVVVPDPSGLERADRALESEVFVAASMGLVFNRLRRGCLARADEVLSNRHGLPVMARIKENRRMADRVLQGHPVHREWALRPSIKRLAASVHPDIDMRAIAWR